MPRFLDPESIFPKRLGLMNGNTIVIEYYDLTRDKFKKHPIPYNPQDEVKSIVDQIFKDAKHIPFIKKVDPKHLRAVLEGQSVAARKEQQKIPEKDRFQEFEEPKPKEREVVMKEEKFQESYDRPSNIISNDSQLSNGKSKPIGKPAKPQQIDDYYAEQFEQFQISQSMDKASKNISISNIQKSKPSLTESNSSISQSKPQIKVLPPKVEEEIEQEYADDFEFVDEEPKKEQKKEVKEEKKEKKEKKDKKDKSKSKEKKGKKEKKKVEEKEVEEQFQFL